MMSPFADSLDRPAPGSADKCPPAPPSSPAGGSSAYPEGLLLASPRVLCASLSGVCGGVQPDSSCVFATPRSRSHVHATPRSRRGSWENHDGPFRRANGLSYGYDEIGRFSPETIVDSGAWEKFGGGRTTCVEETEDDFTHNFCGEK